MKNKLHYYIRSSLLKTSILEFTETNFLLYQAHTTINRGEQHLLLDLNEIFNKIELDNKNFSLPLCCYYDKIAKTIYKIHSKLELL